MLERVERGMAEGEKNAFCPELKFPPLCRMIEEKTV